MSETGCCLLTLSFVFLKCFVRPFFEVIRAVKHIQNWLRRPSPSGTPHRPSQLRLMASGFPAYPSP